MLTPNPSPSLNSQLHRSPPHLTASAGSLVHARETCPRTQAWLKNSLMAGEMVFTLLKRKGTT